MIAHFVQVTLPWVCLFSGFWNIVQYFHYKSLKKRYMDHLEDYDGFSE